MALQAADNSHNVGAFLDYLYDGLEGYVYGATIQRNEAKERVSFEQSFYRWPKQRAEFIESVQKNTNAKDVYLAPAILSSPASVKESFKATNVVWTEFDGTVPSLAGITDVPTPSLRIRSSLDGFEHWYWRLDSPLTDSSTLEDVNRALALKLGADASGWDCTQLLRPVGTKNHKRDAEVSVLEKTDTVVQTVAFDSLPEPPAQPELQLNDIPDVTDVVLKYPFLPQIAALYKTPKVGEGQRSSYLMKLGYYLAEMGMSDAEMFAVLRNADDRWGKFKERTDRNQRLIDLISVARQKYPIQIELTDELPIFGFQSFLDAEIEFNWLIEDLIPEQGYLLLTGPAGVGKTQFSLRAAMAMALGRSDFIGYKIERPMKIVLFSLEMGHSRLLKFVQIMAQTLTAEEKAMLENNLLVIPYGEALYVDSERDQLRAEAVFEAYQPDGFIFDSLGSSTTGELSSESAVKAVMDWNDKVRKRYNLFSWYIHHNRKAQGDNKKPNKMSDVYGNQYIVNRSDTILCLWPDGEKIEVLNLKNRLAEMTQPYKITRTEALDFIKLEATAIINAKTAKTLIADEPTETEKKMNEDNAMGGSTL